jgi:hypothetical protein
MQSRWITTCVLGVGAAIGWPRARARQRRAAPWWCGRAARRAVDAARGRAARSGHAARHGAMPPAPLTPPAPRHRPRLPPSARSVDGFDRGRRPSKAGARGALQAR